MERKELFKRIEEAEKGDEILDLSKFNLVEIPVEVFRLTHLKQLYLTYLRVWSSPIGIPSIP